MRSARASFLLWICACHAPRPTSDTAGSTPDSSDTDGANADTDVARDTDLRDTDLACAPNLQLGTGEGATFDTVVRDDTLSVHFGPQGGFHVFGGVRFGCAGAHALGRFAVLDGDGAQIAGNVDLVPLDVIATCTTDDHAVVTCAGQQIIFTVSNPDVGDAAFFGASYRLAADVTGAGHAEVSIRLSDPRMAP